MITYNPVQDPYRHHNHDCRKELLQAQLPESQIPESDNSALIPYYKLNFQVTQCQAAQTAEK